MKFTKVMKQSTFFSFEFRMKLNQLLGKSVQLRIHLHGEHVATTMHWFVV